VARFEGRTWIFQAAEWIRLADSVGQLGGFSERRMAKEFFESLEKRKYDDMVSETMA
jgi:hypothetical protein